MFRVQYYNVVYPANMKLKPNHQSLIGRCFTWYMVQCLLYQNP